MTPNCNMHNLHFLYTERGETSECLVQRSNRRWRDKIIKARFVESLDLADFASTSVY